MGILLEANAQNMGILQLVLMVGTMIVLYVIMLAPQRKEQKRIAAMISALETGDIVLTTSGFYGTVIDIEDDTVIVEFGNNKNCRIPMQKTAIAQVEKAE